MKANELRLHNRISITEKARKELWECEMDVEPLSTGFITSIDIDQCRILLDSMEYEMDFNDLEPIPLTEEWLLKFSFEKKRDSYKKEVLSYGNISFQFNNGKLMFCELNQYRGYTLGSPEVEFVHSLQNLFFALCGEELTIKTK